jgi:hypothetical protein
MRNRLACAAVRGCFAVARRYTDWLPMSSMAKPARHIEAERHQCRNHHPGIPFFLGWRLSRAIAWLSAGLPARRNACPSVITEGSNVAHAQGMTRAGSGGHLNCADLVGFRQQRSGCASNWRWERLPCTFMDMLWRASDALKSGPCHHIRWPLP